MTRFAARTVPSCKIGGFDHFGAFVSGDPPPAHGARIFVAPMEGDLNSFIPAGVLLSELLRRASWLAGPEQDRDTTHHRLNGQLGLTR